MKSKRPNLKPVANAANPWTPDEDEVLMAGVAKRIAYRFLGEQLGRSREACRDRAKRLGVVKEPTRRRSAYHRGGLSVPQVAGDGPIAAPAPFENLEACNLAHLADLLREYGAGQTLGYAKAVYRARCERHPTKERPFIAPTSGYVYYGSGCSSPAGEVV